MTKEMFYIHNICKMHLTSREDRVVQIKDINQLTNIICKCLFLLYIRHELFKNAKLMVSCIYLSLSVIFLYKYYIIVSTVDGLIINSEQTKKIPAID